MQDMGVDPKGYLLATVHRPYNTDIPEHLRGILNAFLEIGEPLIFPVHPRTRQKIADLDDCLSKLASSGIRLIEPVGYLDMLVLEKNARVILTDSGGIQKEAYFFGVPCVTLRPETEWVETLQDGWNVVTGSEPSLIVEKTRAAQTVPQIQRSVFGDGHAGEKILVALEDARPPGG